MDFENKYLKYKSRYVAMKKTHGLNRSENTDTNVQPPNEPGNKPQKGQENGQKKEPELPPADVKNPSIPFTLTTENMEKIEAYMGSIELETEETEEALKAFYANYSNTLIISQEVKIIPDGFFFGNKHFTKLEFAKKSQLLTIGDMAFSYSQFNGTLTIPDSVTSIGQDAFANNKFTGDLNIPNSVKSIGGFAFHNNEFNGTLTIPDSVTSIGQFAFAPNNFTGTSTIPKLLLEISIENSAFVNNEFTDLVKLKDLLK